MKPKKCFVMASIATCLFGMCTTLRGQEQKDPNQDLNYILKLLKERVESKLLEEKIERLEGIIETQQETIRRLETENERLKRLCSQAGIDVSPQKDKQPWKPESKKLTNASIGQLQQLAATDSQLTTVRRTKLFTERAKLYEKMYAGKYVQWAGQVEKVERQEEGYFMVISHRSFNITVRLREDKLSEQRILSLNKGSVVTYQGKLPDSYDEMQSLSNKTLSLTDGKVIYYP